MSLGLVERLVGNRLQPVPFPVPAEDEQPSDLVEAYKLQEDYHALCAQAGMGHVAGFKIGCTTTVMQEYLGINHPCAGAVLSGTTFRGNGIFPFKKHCVVGVECEIAVRLGKDITPTGVPFTIESVSDAVDACMASIEVVDNRYDDFSKFKVGTLVVDDFFDAGCVLGEPVTDWRDLDLSAERGRLIINDKEVSNGLGVDILGNPLNALVWLANHRASMGQGLEAGQFVTLGSVVKTVWLEANDWVKIQFDNLGEATAEFPG